MSDAGKELNDPRVLTDVGDVPVQEIRDCGVDDDRLMKIISESVKLVMEEVSHILLYVSTMSNFMVFFFLSQILQNISLFNKEFGVIDLARYTA